MSLSSFGPELAADLLPQLRELANSRMLSTATLYRKTRYTTQDETTGAELPLYDRPYIGLPMRLGGNSRGPSTSTTQSVAQGVETEHGVRTAHLPHTTSDLRDGDLIHITAGENADTWWQIQEIDWQDQATARRVQVVAVEEPEMAA